MKDHAINARRNYTRNINKFYDKELFLLVNSLFSE